MGKILFKKIKKIANKYSALPLIIVYTDVHMDHIRALVEVKGEDIFLYVNIFKNKTSTDILEAIAHEIAHVNIFKAGGKINFHGIRHLNETEYLLNKFMEEYYA